MLYIRIIMSATSFAYMEIIEFIAAGSTPEQVIGFRPSAEAEQRLEALMDRERDGKLSADEKMELDHFIELEHILRMAKAKAREMTRPPEETTRQG